MAALPPPSWNDKEFELFDNLEVDDILSCTGQTVNSAVESSASQQRKRRSDAGPRPDKAKHRSSSSSMSVHSDAPPSFVSVTSSAATPAMRGRSSQGSTTVVSAEPLPDGTRLIPDWYAVLGDKQSGGRGRTTTATSLLRDVKEWYKEQKPIYRDEGRLHALMDDALARYFGAVAQAFPDDFPTDTDARQQTILIYCSKEALQSGRVAEPNCFTYEQGKPAKFGLATVPAAISFFLESRDAPSLPSVVRKLRRDFDTLAAQDGAAPQAMLAHFEGLLQFCEMQLQAAASQEMAQILLNKLNLIPALREQWKFLKEHAAANGKNVSGSRSVASCKSSGYNGGKDDDDSTMGGRSRSVTAKEQGKKTASSRKAAAQRMKARQPHDYRTFSHSPQAAANFAQGPFITMQTQQDDASEYSESNYSGSYWSGHPSVVSESTNGGHSRSPAPPLPPYSQQRALDEESLTDVDGWQGGTNGNGGGNGNHRYRHHSNNNMGDDDEGSYQIGGVHRTMRDDSLRSAGGGGMEINVMRSFHDSASAVSAVSSVTAATAVLRMEEDDKSATSHNNYYDGHNNNNNNNMQDDSWNQRALSKLRLHNDDASQQGMDDSGGPRFNIGSSSNDSVTSANSSRRSRSRAQLRRGGRRASRHGAQGPAPPAQPVANVYHVTTISVVDPHGDHGLYTGSISNESGMPHGFGRFEFLKGGRWYEGNWVHGHWTGRGKLSNGDGSHYDGGFQDDLKHGQGVMVWNDGRIFEGMYSQGQMTYGKMKFADGGTYFGCFVNGLQHGKGNMIFADNSKYEGDFERGNFHGKGKMVWNDGGFYEGEWKDGMIHGIGKEIRADGSLRHEGNWMNGAPVR